MKICSHVEALLNSFDNGFIEKSKSLPDLNLASSPFQDHLLVHLFMEICFCPFTLLTLCWAQSPTDNCCRGSNRDEEVTVSKPEDSRSGVRLDACSAFFSWHSQVCSPRIRPPPPIQTDSTVMTWGSTFNRNIQSTLHVLLCLLRVQVTPTQVKMKDCCPAQKHLNMLSKDVNIWSVVTARLVMLKETLLE